MSKAIRKYLESHSEPQSNRIDLSRFSNQIFTSALILPLYGEEISIVERICRWIEMDFNFLLIVIINESTKSPTEMKSRNQEVLAALGRIESSKLLVVNCSQDSALENGVGEARKIGADLALRLFAKGQISKHWIFSTDADVEPLASYFEVLEKLSEDAAAYHFNFFHRSPREIERRTKKYEIYLWDYVEGLAFANSPYAFPTVGSCLGFHLVKYAEARGFPKREAGEDFYLLQKLRKLGGVSSFEEPSLEIEARTTVRTPFGTSAALTSESPVLFYRPECFLLLRDFLQNTHSFLMDDRFSFENLRNISSLWPTELQSKNLQDFFSDLYKRTSSFEQRMLQFHLWFDGFKTLRFIQSWTRQKYEKSGTPLKATYKAPWRPLAALPLLDYIRFAGEQISHGSSIRQTRIHTEPRELKVSR